MRKTSIVESMEVRRMMAVDAFRGETWEVYGTRRDDYIVIEEDAKRPGYLVARNGDTVLGRAAAGVVRRIRVYGGEGNDQIFVKTAGIHRRQTVEGEGRNVAVTDYVWRPFSVSIDAGAGNDKVLVGTDRAWVFGGDGDDSLYGTFGDDVLIGGAGDDLLMGNDGRDRLEGGDGNDTLVGGAHNDTLIGGAGNDRLDGGADRDWLDGSAGRDSLYGGLERDTLIGGKHGDLIERDHHRDDISAVPGQDHVFVTNLLQDWKKNPDGFARTQYAGTSAWGRFGSGGRVFGLSLLASADAAASLYAGAISNTNVQVQGVDEADLLETDGNYIYSVVDGSEVVITDVRNPNDLKVVSRTRLDGNILGLYLDGDRLTAVWQEGAGGMVSQFGLVSLTWAAQSVAPKTFVTTFDIANRASPVQTQQTSVDGNYITSRYVNGRVYLISSFYEASPMVGGEMVEGFWLPEDQAAYEARVRDSAAINGPGYAVMGAGVIRKGSLSEMADQIQTPASPETEASTFVTLIDTAGTTAGPVDSVEFDNAYFGATYITANSIYLSMQSAMTTSITKLGITATGIVEEGTGVVEGRVTGQFAFDETADGVLRVTSQLGFGQNATTTFSTLKDTGDTLKVVGKLSGLAPGEDLYATRYVGDRAYFITYGPDWSRIPRFIDPLFVVDASNAAAPKLLGELKIPGYSQYLHPIDETHLVGLGQRDDDADGRADGLQLSLFDVTNPAKPTRVDTYDFGQLPEEDMTWSAAEWSHLAFTYVPETGLLAVPFNSLKRGSGVEVVKVNKNAGFSTALRLASPTEHWLGLRGVFAGDYVFGVGDNTISSAHLTNPNVGDTISLALPS